jgi:hypothetical protein
LTALLFDNAEVIYPAIAGHNLRSLSHAIAAAQVRGLAQDRWELQMLLGMANPLAEAVAGGGVKLRMYIPMGDLLAGIAYLIRRLMGEHGHQFGLAADRCRGAGCAPAVDAAATVATDRAGRKSQIRKRIRPPRGTKLLPPDAVIQFRERGRRRDQHWNYVDLQAARGHLCLLLPLRFPHFIRRVPQTRTPCRRSSTIG